MRTSQSTEGHGDQAGKSRVFGTSWDGRGRPPWLPAPPGAAWTTIALASDADAELVLDPPELPVVDAADHVSHHGYGRPRVQDRDRDRAETAAFLKDVERRTLDQVAEALVYGDATFDGPRGRARRGVKAGRESLHDRGVLPWAAFASGRVPSDWPEHRDFWRAVRRWSTAATLERAREVDRAPLARVSAYWHDAARR